MEIEIRELSEIPELTKVAVRYFWECWGNDTNFNFYHDCIVHSLDKDKFLPKFYLAVHEGNIIGSYALLVNDIISRQDLMPWFACLFVNEAHRNKGIADQLLKHGLKQAKAKGFGSLYLSTDLENFYERKGWTYFGIGYGVSGGENKMYAKSTSGKKGIKQLY
jgi:GNAT superfamily N-acetyltransferase